MAKTSASPAQPAKVKLPPLEQALEDFTGDGAFAAHLPTREQVARAWALANFSKEDASKPPTHPEVVAALKKMFPQHKDPKPNSSRTDSKTINLSNVWSDPKRK